MSDPSMPEMSSSSENALTSERYKDTLDALELLYIKNNLSGRISFIKEWPVLAQYVLGAELIKFDTEGADDLDRKAELEEEAEIRRYALAESVRNIQEASVQDGVLQTEHVEGLVKNWGRDLALLVYADRIVDKILGPGSSTPKVSEAAALEKAPEEPSLPSDIESQYAPHPQETPKINEPLPTPADMKISEKLVGPEVDNMAEVKPIDLGPPADVKPIDMDAVKPIETPAPEQPKIPPEEGENS